MSTPVAKDQCGGAGKACGPYTLEGVNFKDTHMSAVMDAARRGDKQAEAIVKADQASVSGTLSPASYWDGRRGVSRHRGNLYGTLKTGFRVTQNFTSADGTVKKTFEGWVKQLNERFKAIGSYTPESLGNIVARARHDANCFEAQVGKLNGKGYQASGADVKFWQGVIGDLRNFAKAAETLQRAVQAPGDIHQMILNVSPTKH